MSKTFLLLLLFLPVGIAATPAQNKQEPLAWADSTRDVYVDGKIDRTAQVLTSEETHRIAVISSLLENAIVLDLSHRTAGTIAKASFRFYPDHTIALTESAFAVNPAGVYKLEHESDYSLTIGEKRINITQHQGLVGETDQERLFDIVPVWRFAMESYQPDANVVTALQAYQQQIKITIALATWCSDSKRHVPRLLKALDAAGNSHLQVKLIAIARKLREPAVMIKQLKIVRVPTVIVERNGVEIGRITENPTSNSMEEDLITILTGKRTDE